ncbi:WXG100-like domain-containing protein [Streptacidiphilus sp. PAMC 29251]
MVTPSSPEARSLAPPIGSWSLGSVICLTVRQIQGLGDAMAIELPGELVWVMNLLGLNWPQANEDKVRQFGGHIRDFGRNLDSVHQAVSTTVQQVGEHYQADSYSMLAANWARMSNDHMRELVEVCEVAAVAMEVAADGIIAAKLSVITELGIMAAEFVADQAAAVVTLGAAEAAEVLLVEATKKIVNALLKQLEQQLIGALVEQTLGPLEGAVERAVSGLVFKAVEGALESSSSGSGSGGYMIHPDELLTHSATMHGHAEDLAGHTATFLSATEGYSFT